VIFLYSTVNKDYSPLILKVTGTGSDERAVNFILYRILYRKYYIKNFLTCRFFGWLFEDAFINEIVYSAGYSNDTRMMNWVGFARQRS
jgi:hypothetical protein